MVDKVVVVSFCVKRVFVVSRIGVDVLMGKFDIFFEKVVSFLFFKVSCLLKIVFLFLSFSLFIL